MIVQYWVNCFDRMLCVKFANEDADLEKEVEDILDKAYDMWHSPEEIENDEERQHVEDSCLEEFMIEKMNEVFPAWIEWWVEDEVDENGNEVPIYVTENNK